MIKLGLIGCGYWGEKLFRTFNRIDGCRIIWICDKDQAKSADCTSDFRPILRLIDGVIIATPALTHYPIALECLYLGKHVFVEKPMTMSHKQAQILVREARRRDLRLMVDHLLMFHPAVIRLRSMIELGEIGEVVDIFGSRIGAKVRKDENVMWSLGPHDLSIALSILGKPTAVSASGMIEKGKGTQIEDKVYLNIYFHKGVSASFCFDWLREKRVRQLRINGTRGTLIFDDLNESKLMLERNGEKTAIRIEDWLPLDLACRHFIERIKDGINPLTDGESALPIIEVLETAQRSLDEKRLGDIS